MTTPADDREAFQADIDLLRSILRGYPTSIASRDALAAVARLQSGLSTERARILEPQPSPEHLDSIAMRYRHDFHLLTPEQQENCRSFARQMYEECTGQGFYKIPPLSGS